MEVLSLSFRPAVLKGKQAVRIRGHKAGLTFRKDPKFRLLTFSTHEVIHPVTRDTMTGLEGYVHLTGTKKRVPFHGHTT